MKYFILRTLHPALEDGTDRGFRNVCKPQSDAGEISKRIHTRFKTWRKFKIKYYFTVQFNLIGLSNVGKKGHVLCEVQTEYVGYNVDNS